MSNFIFIKQNNNLTMHVINSLKQCGGLGHFKIVNVAFFVKSRLTRRFPLQSNDDSDAKSSTPVKSEMSLPDTFKLCRVLILSVTTKLSSGPESSPKSIRACSKLLSGI